MNEPSTASSMPLIRVEYEASILALRRIVERVQQEGCEDEAIARSLHAERRALGARFKSRTPAPLRALIDARTVAVYGDPLGLTIEWLRAHGKSWQAIIASAVRPGHGVF